MASNDERLVPLTYRMIGTTPLLMHSDVLANPLSEEAKRLKLLTSKRKKTDEDLEAISRAEFDGGIYCSDKGPYLPGKCILAHLRDAGKLSKNGLAITRGVTTEEPLYYIDLPFKRPTIIPGVDEKGKIVRSAKMVWRDFLWNEGCFDRQMVGNQKARVLRTRACFNEWACSVTISYDLSVFDERTVLDIIAQGGRKIGIGDYRPFHGRYEVEVVR